MITSFMASAKQIAWRKKFAKLYGKKKTGSKSTKSKKTEMYHEHPFQKTTKKPIAYHSETKKKAEENRRYYEKMDGVKIKPPVKTKGKVPHHNNNYWYWTIYRPVTW
tara:strand:- start:212 stop:532 length:321 start_codon:yes stop_codon:yes gene_type:complete